LTITNAVRVTGARPHLFMNFPAYTKTKAEAQRLAAELFPDEKTAIAKIAPDVSHPRYHLTHTTADTLRTVFFWLHEQHPKIYKRARWHLFYDMAHRIAVLLDENAQAKVRDLYANDHAKQWQRKQAAEIVTGDGHGI
jgi:hypothetical protein